MKLIVLLTVVLLEDQIDKWLILLFSHLVFNNDLVLHNTKKKINIITLIFKYVSKDKNIWKKIRKNV